MYNNPSHNHYQDYQLIPVNDYRSKIRYYDRYKEAFDQLDEDQELDIKLDYIKALFAVGNYHRYVNQVDPLIEKVIINNVYIHQGENIYESLLFKKAAALNNMRKYHEAVGLTKSLVKINPEYPLAQRLLSHCIRRRGKTWYELMKAMAILCMFSAVSILFAEFLIVGPFYNESLENVMILRTFLIGTTLVLLLSREIAMIWTIKSELKSCISKKKNNR